MTQLTTFVLGAGASHHLGFPTGDKLVTDILEVASRNSFFLWLDRYPLWEHRNIKRFGRTLRNDDPTSIDSFLTRHGKDDTLVKVGKVLIFNQIASAQFYSSYRDPLRKNWYRYLKEALLKSPDQIRIITFNYDLSLEYYLHKSFLDCGLFSSPDEATAFFFEKVYPNIYHIYGSVWDYRNSKTIYSALGADKNNPHKRYNAHTMEMRAAKSTYFDQYQLQNIRVIGDDRNASEIDSKFKDWLRNTAHLYILGFGFVEENCKLLELQELSKSIPKVYCTNYEGIPKIQNRIYSNISSYEYLNGKTISTVGRTEWNLAISHNSVCDAFDKEFDIEIVQS